MSSVIYNSPIGKILLTAKGTKLTHLTFLDEVRLDKTCNFISDDKNEILNKAARWLDAYFSGKKPDFSLEFQLFGTPFQLLVWDILQKIPYGETITYGEIAEKIAQERGMEKMSSQAVGRAVGQNKIPIIIPCHRVIGQNFNLTGYIAGIEKKRFLLNLEGVKI